MRQAFSIILAIILTTLAFVYIVTGEATAGAVLILALVLWLVHLDEDESRCRDV